jgi:hypothetical protein
MRPHSTADPRISAVLQGRHEVWLRIIQPPASDERTAFCSLQWEPVLALNAELSNEGDDNVEVFERPPAGHLHRRRCQVACRWPPVPAAARRRLLLVTSPGTTALAAEDMGYFQNRGWDKVDAKTAAINAAQGAS